MQEAAPTVFLVDDDAAVRKSLSRALEKRGMTVAAFESARSFLDSYESGGPGCLVLDLSMPGMTGLELQQKLAQSAIDIPIIFITGHGDIPQSVRAIKAGAIDFLEKPFRTDVLMEQIQEAFRKDAQTREEQQRGARARRRFNRLTQRERDVAALLASGSGNMSSKEIAASLGISPRTVDHHRARVMEKTGARSVTELAALAALAGFSEPQNAT